MNRIDFMNQLESLLQNIAPGEREEALQYYNCYFDDAGEENEQDVLEALGTPAKVAENIKRDLLENGGAEAAARKVKASDRALVEYGKSVQNDTEESEKAAEGKDFQKSESGSGGGAAGFFETYSRQEQDGGNGNIDEAWTGYGYQDQTGCDVGGSQAVCGQPGQSGQPGKGLPGWAVALIVIAVVMFSPAAAGLAAGAFGILAGWFGMIVGFGVATVVLFLVMVLLVVLGIMCSFASPWAGCALMGGGLLCGALGLAFLMLTVAMAGIVTPAIFRGIRYLFRKIKGAR